MFILPDPITFRENDLVSINRYAYGANNPYKYTDPTGMAGFSNCAMYGGCSATPEEMRQNLYNVVDFFIPIDLARECYNGGSGCTTAAVLIEGAGFLFKPAKLLRRVERLCFVEGTLVETPDGKVAIEDIKVGDWVLSKDDLTGTVAFKQVTTLFRNADKLIYELSVVNEQGETEVIGTTAEHPFYVKDKGWTKAIQLLVGDKITTADDNIVTVFAVKLSPTRQDTYNFEVDDYHTYFVGENKLWVHNDCPLNEAAKRLGIDLDDINIVDGRAKINIDLVYRPEVGDFIKIRNELRRRGAKSLEIDTGPVINNDLFDMLQDRYEKGLPFLGGEVKKGGRNKDGFVIILESI